MSTGLFMRVHYGNTLGGLGFWHRRAKYMRLSTALALLICTTSVTSSVADEPVTETKGADSKTESVAVDREAVVEKEALKQEELHRLMDEWTVSLHQRNWEKHMLLYAPTLSRYFGDSNITKAAVQSIKEKTFYI